MKLTKSIRDVILKQFKAGEALAMEYSRLMELIDVFDDLKEDQTATPQAIRNALKRLCHATDAEIDFLLNVRAQNTPPKITEKQFQAWVRKAALTAGWRYYHTWNSFRSPSGFPDCVMVHAKKRKLIFAELKSETGKVSEQQWEWLLDIQEMRPADKSVDVYVWRPSDMDKIWDLLKGQ